MTSQPDHTTSTPSGNTPPDRLGSSNTSQTDRSKLTIAIGSLCVMLAVLSALAGWSQWMFGSVGAGVALLAGERLFPTHEVIELGDVPAGSTVAVEIPLQNLSSSPLTVLGARPDCSCVQTSGLPLTLPARSTASIQAEIAVRAREPDDELTQRIEVYSDHSATGRWITLHGRIVDVNRVPTILTGGDEQ